MIIKKECPLCGKEVAIRLGEKEYVSFLYGSGLIQERIPNIGAVEREFLKTGYCHSCQELIFGGFNRPQMERWIDVELIEMAEMKCGSIGYGVVMNISDFKPMDIVRITVYDCFSGEAIVRIAEEDRLVADWLNVSNCYECQTEYEDSVEITKNDFENDIVAELVLLARK